MISQPVCTIRRAGEADAGGILACLQAAFAPYREQYSLEAFRDTVLTAETVHERLAAMAVFVALAHTGQIVGTIGCGLASAEDGHIRGMAVLHEWQGAGVASQLLTTAESELRSRNCCRVTLDTTAPLERATRFYEKHGYRRSGKVGDFFGMPLFEYVKNLK